MVAFYFSLALVVWTTLLVTMFRIYMWIYRMRVREEIVTEILRTDKAQDTIVSSLAHHR